MSKDQVFTAPTQSEANSQADEWWAQQKGLRLIQRTKWLLDSAPLWLRLINGQ